MDHQKLRTPRYEHFREPALAFLRHWAARGQVLVVASTRTAADEWARAACETALLGIHRTTPAHLAAALSAREIAIAGQAPVTSLVVTALAARVANQALSEHSLRYFEPVARTPGFATALASTLLDLQLDGVSEEALAAGEGPARDIAVLLGLYREELRERQLVDLADQFHAAIRTVRAGSHVLCGLPILLVDVTAENALPRDLIAALAERSPAVLDLALGTAEFPVTTSLESLQRYLFAAEVPARKADETVEVFAASGEALECVEVSRRALDTAERGVAFDRMAILMRSPDRYQPMVEEALRRAGIPAFSHRGSRRPYVSGRAFLALLECAREGLTASKFAEYLSLGQAPESADRPVEPPAQWERLLVDAAVVGGAARWKRRLEGLAETFRAAYHAAPDDTERDTSERRLQQVERLAAFALPMIDRLAALPSSATWGDWLPALHELAIDTLRDSEAVTALLDELAPMSDIGPVDLSAVLLVLEPRLRALRQPAEGLRYGRIFVASIEEARGMIFDVVFLPGLNEGSFPRPPSEDPLLLDQYRESIPGASPRAKEDNDLLCLAAACAHSRLVLSYSRLDLVTGRQRVPSFYVFETLRAARGQGVDVREIEKEAERGAPTRIGWPAPTHARDAIDDAEFDLATLRPAFEGDGKGMGAYLTKVNPHLVRSLRARGRRWRRHWYREDGLTGLDIHELQILEKHRLAARPYSVSALQQFAQCPYRFALRAIHRLHPARHPDAIQRMDPAIRGEIFHRTQFEVLRELRESGELPVQAAATAAAAGRLNRALDRVAAEFAEKLAPAIAHVWRTEVEALRADLQGWLQQSTDPNWLPAWFEFAFGLDPSAGHDPASVPAPVAVLDGALLHGSIDLIEQHANGTLRVTDHKTGSPPKKKPEATGFGEVLQPVLYSLVAEKVLEQQVALGRLSYATLKQNFRTIEIQINEWNRQQAGRVLRIIDNSIHNGFLPAAPREDACRNCDYLPVCGPYEEERWRLKPSPELKPLQDLRRIS